MGIAYPPLNIGPSIRYCQLEILYLQIPSRHFLPINIRGRFKILTLRLKLF